MPKQQHRALILIDLTLESKRLRIKALQKENRDLLKEKRRLTSTEKEDPLIKEG